MIKGGRFALNPGVAPENLALGPGGRLFENDELLITAQVIDADAGDEVQGSLRLVGCDALGDFVAQDQSGTFTVSLCSSTRP